MAGTISKNLKLIGILDDSQIKQQLKQLKKELGASGIGGAANVSGEGIKGFDKVIKELGEAANALKTIAKNFKEGGKTATGVARGKSKVEEEKEILSLREKNLDKEYQEKERRDKKAQRDIAKHKEEERRKDIKVAKDAATASLSRFMGMPAARTTTEVVANMFPKSAQSIGGFMRGGLAGGAKALLGNPLGLGIAGAGLAVGGLAAMGLSTASSMRNFRTIEAQKEQEVAMSMMQGKMLEASLRSGARGNVGLLERAGRGLTGMLGAFNPFGSNFAPFSPIMAARANITSTENKEIDATMAQTAAARGALDVAKRLRSGRLDSLRGGGITSQELTELQLRGAASGFSSSDTVSQFGTLKGMFGSGPAGSTLMDLQNLANQTGISVNAGAEGLNTLLGSRGGQSLSTSNNLMIDTLKKGVAAGLDVSRSGKFLQTTAEFISSTQGLANVDAGSIATSLAEAARGFAAGGPVTDTALQQAQKFQTMTQQGSFSLSGLAGVGNIFGLKQAVPELTSQQLMSASLISSNASEEDIAKLLNISPEQAAAVKQAKSKNATVKGAGLLTSDPQMQAMIMALSGGTPLEEAANTINVANQVTGGISTKGVSLKSGVENTPEFKNAVAEFSADQIAFQTGMRSMADESAKAAENLKILTTQLQESYLKLNRVTNGQSIDEGTSRATPLELTGSIR